MHDSINLEYLRETAIAEFKNYAHARQSDVKRNAETPVLAATLVEKYGQGFAMALGLISREASADFMKIVDEECIKIDPNHAANRQKRWAARPADISMIVPAQDDNVNQDLVSRLRIRAAIRRNIQHRKSVQEGTPDRIASLLDEAADKIEFFEKSVVK